MRSSHFLNGTIQRELGMVPTAIRHNFIEQADAHGFRHSSSPNHEDCQRCGYLIAKCRAWIADNSLTVEG